MSRSSLRLGEHATRRPSLVLLLSLPLLLALGTIGSAHAQTRSDSSSKADESGPPHRRMLRFGALEGPPAPVFMRDSLEVTGKELQQYTQRYESHMAATKASRDSVRSSMQAARAAFEKGDRSAARTQRETTGRQWKQLADQDRKFEASLKDVLNKAQLSRFQEWKDQRREAFRAERQQHRQEGGRGGWGRRHDSAGDSSRSPDSSSNQTR
jgi:hypothetical protein